MAIDNSAAYEPNKSSYIPETESPAFSDSTSTWHADVETASKFFDDIDWASGVPGRKCGALIDASAFIDLGENIYGKSEPGDSPISEGANNNGLEVLSDKELGTSYRELKNKLYTKEGQEDPELKKQLSAVETEKVSRLKTAMGKGEDAFAKAIEDIDFDDRDNANLTCIAFGNLCREGGFGGSMKYGTDRDTGKTDVRILMKKDNAYDVIDLNKSKPTPAECKVLAKAVHKSMEQKGTLPPPAKDSDVNSGSKTPDAPAQDKPLEKPVAEPKADKPGSAREVNEKGKLDPVSPEVAKHLEKYRNVFELMENISNYDINRDKTVTLEELKKLETNVPEMKKAAAYAIENFKELSGGTDSITRDSLKKPLIGSLVDGIKASKDGELHPAVKQAMASWITMPADAEELTYLENKINGNLEGSGLSVKISKDVNPDFADKRIPVTTISLKSNRGTQQFSYTMTDDARRHQVPGTPMKGGYYLIDPKAFTKK